MHSLFENDLLLLFVFIALASSMILILHLEQKRCEKFRLIAEGRILKEMPKVPVKANVWVGTSIFHLIFFEDGKTITVMDVNIPPPGTYIKVYKNGKADFRIEIVPDKE